jgi:hypothetical protein
MMGTRGASAPWSAAWLDILAPCVHVSGMAHVKPLPPEQLTEFEPFFKLVEGVMGFVPSSLYTMGRRPAMLRAFAGLSASVLGPGDVEPGLKQLVAMVASVSRGAAIARRIRRPAPRAPG